jgi:mannosyltransferase
MRKNTGPSTSVYLAALGLLVILGTALRLYQLGTALWYDEIVTVLLSVRPALGTILTHFPGNNDHPLYSVLAHLCVSLFGENPWALRIPAALFGIASIPLLYLLGTEVTSRLESALAVSILTVSYHHIWFSQNARGYTMLAFWVLLSTYLLLRWLAGHGNWNLVLYAVVTALGAYTHLTMVFVAVSQALACALSIFGISGPLPRIRSWTKLAAGFVGAAILTVLLYAPMLTDMQAFFTTDVNTSTQIGTASWAIQAALQGLQSGFGSLWILAAGAVVFGSGVWSYFRTNNLALYLLLIPAPLTVAAALAMQRPIFPRFVFFAIGSVLLITVRGASQIGKWLARWSPRQVEPLTAGNALALLFTAAAIVFSIKSLPYGYRYPKQDYARAVEFVEQRMKSGDLAAAVSDTGATPVVDYMGRPWRRIERKSDLENLRTQGQDVWVLYTFSSYIEANQPDLWALLQNECSAESKTEATVAGGQIRISRCSSLD